MCIIILDTRPGTERLEYDVFKRAAERNPDGLGIMWPHNGTLRTWRDMSNLRGLWTRYCNARMRGAPVAAHFRLGTHGAKDVTNCHPFLVNDNLGLMHNGVLSGFDKLIPEDMSDTRFFTTEFLAKLPKDFIDNPLMLTLVNKIASGDRLLFMDGEGKYKILTSVYGYSQGRWEIGNAEKGGVWFSNGGGWYCLNGSTVTTIKPSSKEVADEGELPFLATGGATSGQAAGTSPASEPMRLFDFGFLDLLGYDKLQLVRVGDGYIPSLTLWTSNPAPTMGSPFVRLGAPSDRVHGTVYEIKDKSQLLDLDLKHGCNIAQSGMSVHHRYPHIAMMNNGPALSVLVYENRKMPSIKRVIQHGSWPLWKEGVIREAGMPRVLHEEIQ